MSKRLKIIAYLLWIAALAFVLWIGISNEIDRISFDKESQDMNQGNHAEDGENEIYIDLDIGNSEYTKGVLSEGKEFGERFYSKVTELNSIAFKTVTWNNVYFDSDKLRIMIRNNTNNSLLYETSISLREFGDSSWYTLTCGEIPLAIGEWYSICFALESERKTKDYFDLMCADVVNEELAYGITEDKKQNWDILLKIYGK